MIAGIELFEALKTRFGEQEAKIIVKEIEKIESGIEVKIEKEFDRKKETLATREDLVRVEGNLRTEISKLEAKLTMRMFYFWIGQAAVIAGMLTFFFNIYKNH